ncbi:protein-tyrosine phosphatase-like protein [Tribonema minus]|uniref:protein-tyrosine-phosphatase n=1 Tax=Tribonema minus TaxID=303371 RepID=A0A835ZD16_9STRA|nr:protein-tyrosine phosphatase-like protein [Tribonema minus]
MCRQTRRRAPPSLVLNLEAAIYQQCGVDSPPSSYEAAPRLVRRKPTSLSLNIAVEEQHKDAFATEQAARILDWLAIAGEDITLDKDAMKAMGITHIINCTRHCPNLFPDHSGQPVPTEGFHYLKLSLQDSIDQDITSALAPSFRMIEEARACGGCCLVHCSSGMSRSATITIAYLVQHRNMTLLDAMHLTKDRRRQTSPNPGFVSQLLDLEHVVHACHTLDLGKYCEDRFASTASWTPEVSSSSDDSSSSSSEFAAGSSGDETASPRRPRCSSNAVRSSRHCSFFADEEEDGDLAAPARRTA